MTCPEINLNIVLMYCSIKNELLLLESVHFSGKAFGHRKTYHIFTEMEGVCNSHKCRRRGILLILLQFDEYKHVKNL